MSFDKTNDFAGWLRSLDQSDYESGWEKDDAHIFHKDDAFLHATKPGKISPTSTHKQQDTELLPQVMRDLANLKSRMDRVERIFLPKGRNRAA